MSSPAAFPVPDDFFAHLRVTERQLNHLRANADSAIHRALDLFQTTTQTRRASRVSTRHTDQTAPNRSTPSRTTSQAVGTLNGEYTAIVGRLVSTTRQDYFNTHKAQFNFTSDAHVLHTVPPSPARAVSSMLHHEAIKWTAYELFPLRAHADSCHYEATGQGMDDCGRPYAFHVVVPASFPEVPDLFQSKRAIRILSTQVILTRPHGANALVSEVFVSMLNDFRSSHVHRTFSSRFRANLGAVATLPTASLVTPSTPWVFERGSWIKHTPPACCMSCLRAFTMLRGRQSCMVCSRSVCRKCAVKATKVLDATSNKHRGRNANASVCTPCATALCDDAKPFRPSDSPSSTTGMSSAGQTRDGFSYCSPSISTPDAIHPFARSAAPQAYTESPTPPLFVRSFARDRSAGSRPTRARSMSFSLSPPLTCPDPSDELAGVEQQCIVDNPVRTPVKEKLDVLVTVETSDMMRVAEVTTEHNHAFQKISAGLHAQAALLTRMRHQMVTQRRRRTQ